MDDTRASFRTTDVLSVSTIHAERSPVERNHVARNIRTAQLNRFDGTLPVKAGGRASRWDCDI